MAQIGHPSKLYLMKLMTQIFETIQYSRYSKELSLMKLI